MRLGFGRRRGNLSEHAPINEGGGQRWIAIGRTGGADCYSTVIFVLGLRLLAAFPIHGAQGGMATMNGDMQIKPDIVIVGHQWWWEVTYPGNSPDEQVTTANEIHIPINRPVNIELRSQDVMHSFWVPALHGKVDLIPGFPNYIRWKQAMRATIRVNARNIAGPSMRTCA